MKVLVGLSGGVDSATTAYLLKQQGHEVVGATMSIWNKNTKFSETLHKKGCFSPHQAEDEKIARSLCQKLGIEYMVFDCSKQYNEAVLKNFKEEYLNGRTPNPCVLCNALIKFNVLPQAAREAGISFDKFATGHYAKLKFDKKLGLYQILKAKDNRKDQSYFLYRLSQQQLEQIMLPLGEYSKDEVRKIAQNAGLEVSNKPDSQDFYGGDINDILQFENKQGNFVNAEGKVLGQHNGIWNFTVGQRRGLGVFAEKPLYVTAIDKEKNEVTLGFAEECFKQQINIDNVVWTSVLPPQTAFECEAKVRSSQTAVKVKVEPNGNEAKIYFAQAQKALTCGQSAVLYQKELLLGGGFIKSVK